MGSPNTQHSNPYLLAVADRQISILKSKILPIVCSDPLTSTHPDPSWILTSSKEPHLLLVEDQTPHLRLDPYQYRGTPFEPYEVRHLQYLTMVSDENRGLAHPQGNWLDEIESCSPAAMAMQGSSASAKELKIPSKKISIADYKKLRKDGNPKSTTANGRVGSRSSSTPSSEPMSRGPSLENAHDSKCAPSGHKTTDAKGLLKAQLAEFKAEARSTSQLSNPPFENGNRFKNVNGNAPPSIKSSTEPRAQKQKLLSPIKPSIKLPLPPRPQSPRRNEDLKVNSTGLKQPKRPLDYNPSTPTQAQKRTKIRSATLSSSARNTGLQKTATSDELKTPPVRSPELSAKQLPLTPPPPPPRKTVPLKSVNTKITPSKLTPIPPLLSPLPADLDDSPDFELLPLPTNKKPLATTSSSTKIYSKSSDDPVTKNMPGPLKVGTSRRSSSPAFVQPPLLSPNLPPIVERELARLQKKNSALNSVEARHEKVRRPDAPGVARKTISKVGHPPKKSSEPSKVDLTAERKPNEDRNHTGETKKKFIVKIKYKKRRAKDIERILRMTSKVPSARFQELEVERLATLRNKLVTAESEVLPKDTNPSLKSAAPSSTPKKRRSDNFEVPSPTSKRAKVQNVEVGKSQALLEPPFHSPARPSVSSRKSLSTPNKVDMKGVSMRNIPSSDDAHAHTPSASTPASAEKRSIAINSSALNSLSRPDATKYVSEALSIKRKMDSELKTKDVNARKNLSHRETQIGLCTGIECLLAYYSAFSIKKENRPSDRANSWESTLGLLEFVVRTAEPFLALQTLAAQLNALVKEELNRSYLDHVFMTKEAPTELLEKIVRNAQSRDRYWTLANKGREVLRSLGFPETVGPWTGWRDGREYFLGVLMRYEAKEKLGWKPLFD